MFGENPPAGHGQIPVQIAARLQVRGLLAMAGPSVSQVPGRAVHRKQSSIS